MIIGSATHIRNVESPNLLEKELKEPEIPERVNPCLRVERIAVAPAAEVDVWPVLGGDSSSGVVSNVSLHTVNANYLDLFIMLIYQTVLVDLLYDAIWG